MTDEGFKIFIFWTSLTVLTPVVMILYMGIGQAGWWGYKEYEIFKVNDQYGIKSRGVWKFIKHMWSWEKTITLCAGETAPVGFNTLQDAKNFVREKLEESKPIKIEEVKLEDATT